MTGIKKLALEQARNAASVMNKLAIEPSPEDYDLLDALQRLVVSIQRDYGFTDREIWGIK